MQIWLWLARVRHELGIFGKADGGQLGGLANHRSSRVPDLAGLVHSTGRDDVGALHDAQKTIGGAKRSALIGHALRG